MAGKFGEDFNLAIWQITKNTKLNSHILQHPREHMELPGLARGLPLLDHLHRHGNRLPAKLYVCKSGSMHCTGGSSFSGKDIKLTSAVYQTTEACHLEASINNYTTEEMARIGKYVTNNKVTKTAIHFSKLLDS